jgi:WD40 repeat protein
MTEPALTPTARFSPAWSVTLADHVVEAAWSPDGTLLAAGSSGGDVVIVDAKTGEVITGLTDHPLGVLSIGWSPDGTRLAVGGQDDRLSIFERSSGKETHLDLGDWVGALAWSPAGRHLAAAAGRTVVTTDADVAVTHRYGPHPSTVTSLAWGAKGRRVAAAFYGGVSWYDPGRADDRPTDSHKWKGSILALAASGDGRWLAAGSQDRSVQLWRLGKAQQLEMPGYPAKIDQLAFDPSARYLAVGSVGFVTVWDCAGKGPAGTKPRLLDGHARRITSQDWQPNGRALVTGDASGVLAWWAPHRNAKPTAVVEVGAEITAARWHPCDSGLAVTTAAGQLLYLPSS